MRPSTAGRRAYQLEIGSDAFSLAALELSRRLRRSPAEANFCIGEQNESHLGASPSRVGTDRCPGHSAKYTAGGPGTEGKPIEHGSQSRAALSNEGRAMARLQAGRPRRLQPEQRKD